MPKIERQGRNGPEPEAHPDIGSQWTDSYTAKQSMNIPIHAENEVMKSKDTLNTVNVVDELKINEK